MHSTGQHTIESSGIETGSDLSAFIEKMRREKCHERAIDTFSMYYRQLRSGIRGLLPETDLSPISRNEISDYGDTFPNQSLGESLLGRMVSIKLNGGLGTTMGCDGPKSLIKIKNGLDFLSLTIKNVCKTSKSTGEHPALVLMNSFYTDTLTNDALESHPAGWPKPRSFIQHKFPKVSATTFLPVEYPENPQLEWNPPGHGDLFSAMETSGLLSTLLAQDFRYAFISNIDNVGAVPDAGILGFMASHNIHFLMEVTDRYASDRKGGHVARHRDGRLLLRESAQCPDRDLDAFSDISRHQFFNTNNLWIDLVALRKLLVDNKGILNLPLICNRKFLDPVDPATPAVFQLESAMGAAISLFSSAVVLRVPRTRFIPVKNCEDLLLVQSDNFTIRDDFTVKQESVHLTDIKLDRLHYGTVDQLAGKFPFGPPSIRACSSLKVEGDVIFGRNVSIAGSITITNRSGRPHRIPDDSRIEHDLEIT